MKQTRRSTEYRRVEAGQRTAQPFTRIEAPVGGWNTRDSEDSIAPTDALLFDNWWPDIGEVRTRPGYSQHCFTGDATSGSNLVLNPEFETAGGDTFTNWTDSTNNGKVSQSTEVVKGGTYSCALTLTIESSSSYASVTQAIATTALKTYRLKFWDLTNPGVEWETGSLQYKIYDVTNAANIVDWTATGHISDSGTMEDNTIVFSTPLGCVSVEISFRAYLIYTSSTTYVDQVSLYLLNHDPGSIETLIEYSKGSDRNLVAADNNELFNVTSATPTLISAGGGATYSNNRWQCVNFDGHLGMVNGAECVKWAGPTYDYGGGAGLVAQLEIFEENGTTPLTPISCNVFKNRTWFWEANTQDVWYSALNALGGTCTSFPLSRVGQFGGNLILMETWTRDGGSGPDDYAVFVMSSGEAIVYQGSYPGAAGDWALVGIYNIGEPVGYRSAVKFGGDLYIITKLDVVRMSEVIQGVEARQMESKIVTSHRTAIQLYDQNWGWESIIYPRGHMAIFNIPVTENEETDQHVQNTITGAWARFKGIIANTWCLFDSDMYIGGNDGYIYKFDDGEVDYVDSIESTFQSAWLPIGGTGANKLFKLVRESYKTNADITVNNVFATDFKAFAAQQFPVAIDDDSAPWDISPWDTTPWSASDVIHNEWESIGAFGERISMRKRLNTNQRVTFLGSDWIVEVGDRL